jgi:hypothetical protein
MIDTNQLATEGENISIASERESLSDQSSDESTNTCSSQSYLNEEHRAPTRNRYYFDKGMHDNLQNIIILKVYSHQLNRDFVVEDSGKEPSPNLFITSANQHADNAASIAKEIIIINHEEYDDIQYPPFSPRWCFTFEGHAINKGAHKWLRKKMDDKLYLRLQHRYKQGLFSRLLSFIGLTANQLGYESLL